jgi:hypothetical protein
MNITFKNSYRRRIQLRNARLRFWRKQADHFLALGLTTRGTVRKYLVGLLSPSLHGQRRKREWTRQFRRRLAADGFTSRGRSMWSPAERTWRDLRRDIQLPKVDLDTTRLERQELV